MKQFLLITCIAFGLSGFAQDMKPYKVDENLSVDLPEDVTEVDTMGQTIITAYMDAAVIMISVIASPDHAFPTEKELKMFYRGFRKGAIAAADGKLIEESTVRRNQLTWGQFSFFVHSEGEDQVRYVETLKINDKIYAVQWWTLKENQELYQDERKKLFASIQTSPDLTLEDQLTPPENNAGATGYEKAPAYQIGRLFGFLLIPGIIVLVVYLNRQQKKKNQQF